MLSPPHSSSAPCALPPLSMWMFYVSDLFFILISFFAISSYDSCYILQQQITRRATADDGTYTRCVLCIVHTACTLQIVIHIRAKIHNVKRKNFWIISCLHRRFYYSQYFGLFHVCLCECLMKKKETERESIILFSIPLLLMFLLLLLAVFWPVFQLEKFRYFAPNTYVRT